MLPRHFQCALPEKVGACNLACHYAAAADSVNFETYREALVAKSFGTCKYGHCVAHAYIGL